MPACGGVPAVPVKVQFFISRFSALIIDTLTVMISYEQVLQKNIFTASIAQIDAVAAAGQNAQVFNHYIIGAIQGDGNAPLGVFIAAFILVVLLVHLQDSLALSAHNEVFDVSDAEKKVALAQKGSWFGTHHYLVGKDQLQIAAQIDGLHQIFKAGIVNYDRFCA